jgi:2-methylcitrate dehydratase PrpD
MEAAYPRHYGARVELELANGERRGSKVMDPHGMPADPCSERERLDKFSRLASRVKSAQSITEIVNRVRSAERLRSAREIGDLLRE